MEQHRGNSAAGNKSRDRNGTGYEAEITVELKKEAEGID